MTLQTRTANTRNMAKTPAQGRSRTRTNAMLDLGLLAAFLLATAPRATGLTVHEWLGIAFGATILVHLLLHWQWLVEVTRRFFGRLPGKTRLNYALNTLLFLAVVAVVLSGVLISESALPLLGITLQAGRGWRMLHSLAADAALLLIAVHVGLHWSWIAGVVSTYIVKPVRRRFGTRRALPAPATAAGQVEVQS